MPSIFDNIPSQSLPDIAGESARIVSVTEVETETTEKKPCSCKSMSAMHMSEQRLDSINRRLSMILAVLMIILAFATLVRLYRKTAA